MAREGRQPVEEAPERPLRTHEELRASCGRSIGFLLALGMIGAVRESIGAHTTRADIGAAPAAIDLCRRIHEMR